MLADVWLPLQQFNSERRPPAQRLGCQCRIAYLSGAAIQSDHSNPDRLLQEVPKDLHAFSWEYAQR